MMVSSRDVADAFLLRLLLGSVVGERTSIGPTCGSIGCQDALLEVYRRRSYRKRSILPVDVLVLVQENNSDPRYVTQYELTGTHLSKGLNARAILPALRGTKCISRCCVQFCSTNVQSNELHFPAPVAHEHYRTQHCCVSTVRHFDMHIGQQEVHPCSKVEKRSSFALWTRNVAGGGVS